MEMKLNLMTYQNLMKETAAEETQATPEVKEDDSDSSSDDSEDKPRLLGERMYFSELWTLTELLQISGFVC